MTIELNKEYQWNQNWASRFANNTDINKVVEELKDIEEVHGKIDPDLIIKSSKNKKSCLYSYFEWDNEKAAHKWRLNQASNLLAQIEVKIVSNGEAKIIKVFQITKFANGYTNSIPEYSSSSSSSSRLLISSCLGDLRRVRNKLISHDISEPIEHIEKAIEILSKDSTETKKEVKPPLVAVS